MTTKTVYVCQSCGSEQPQWFGRCPACESWNSLVEEIRRKEPKRAGRGASGAAAFGAGGARAAGAPPADLGRMDAGVLGRIGTGLNEFDRVLGGGLVPGAVVLLGGDPGIGKSTLLLQISAGLVGAGATVLYVSGEESARQIHLRASRLGALSEGLLVAAETDLAEVLAHLETERPQVAVIDSIQTMRQTELGSMPGSVAQVRECALALIDYAKRSGAAVLLVGHVTKDGLVAGPRTLEHMVDAVLYFEGDRFHHYRILRAAKNRFGATHEVGVFEMKDKGLAEVPNPSQALLSDRSGDAAGCAVVASLEGTRPLLVEVQALVAPKAFSYPQRVATGIEVRRLTLLLAVLDQRAGIDLSNKDVFVSVAGGFRLDDPAVDLGLAVAVAGAEAQLPLDSHTLYLGEVGLGGEIRRIRRADLRIGEAARLGFRLAVVPRANEADCRNPGRDEMEILGVRTLREALEKVIGPRGARRRRGTEVD